MKILFAGLLATLFLFAGCGNSNNEPQESSTVPTSEMVEPSESTEVEIVKPANGYTAASMDSLYGKHLSCIRSGTYVCSKAGKRFSADTEERLANGCDNPKWNSGCPPKVRTPDGATWKLVGGCELEH